MRFASLILFAFLALPVVAQLPQTYCSQYKGLTAGKRLEITDRRSDSIDVMHAHLKLDMTAMSTKFLRGEARLDLIAKLEGVTEIRLDLEGLAVDSVQAAVSHTYQYDNRHLVIQFSDPLSTSASTAITVFYKGYPIKDASGWGGFYYVGEFAWNLGVGFASDPHSYGRVWFPCFDNFIERSTMSFEVTTPPGKFASCNGILIDSSAQPNGNLVTKWEMNQAIPSYLACVSVGPYVVLDSEFAGLNGTTPIQLFARAADTTKLKASFIHLNDAIHAFESAYGPYRFDKVGYSLVPFNSGAMEHATNITYPIYAANGSLSNESLMTHELAHMWWGDNVTCQTDGDMWINEGWASFSEYLVDEYVYGREAYEKHLLDDLRYMLQYGHHFEGGYRAVSGQPHEFVYGDHVYKKGALVANTLRGYMGDELFFGATSAFMDAYAYSPVSSDSLERFFSDFSGIDLSYFFRDWIYQGGWNAVVLDSFRVTELNAEITVQCFLQQKLKGRTAFHDEVPVYLCFYDENWNRFETMVHLSGQHGDPILTLPFQPVWVTINESNQVSQAVTADQLVLKEAGTHQLQNMYWTVVVESVQDSALLRCEQIWSYPDPIKEWSSKAFKLADNRYWRVTGIGLDQAELSGQFFYDGRASGASGYLDINLLTQTEDSLILLYRKDASEDWKEYKFYEKDVMGISENALGLMKLERILQGEYTLANRDHSVLATRPSGASVSPRIFPNPNHGTLHLNDPDSVVNRLNLYALDGKLLHTAVGKSNLAQVDVSFIAPQVLIYELLDQDDQLMATGKLVIK